MDEKEHNQGPIINSGQEELKPMDYKFIEELTKDAGLTEEYLKECKEVHKKHKQEDQKNKVCS